MLPSINMPASVAIKRVISCFLLSGDPTRETLRVVVFHRVSTMREFPGHWAACSGSIEKFESPWQSAERELSEETNLVNVKVHKPGGLYLDVPFQENKIIRVYPFTADLPSDISLELGGTEHDAFQSISVEELEGLQPTVPSLAMAFHHATFGRYLPNASKAAREWANNRQDGALVMAKKAVHLVQRGEDPNLLRMLRPSMVAITNALALKPTIALESLEANCVTTDYIANKLEKILLLTNKRKVTVATHSRSSTIVNVLQALSLRHEVDIVCGQSTPGDEGALMAKNVDGILLSDNELVERIRDNAIDLLLVGCDCITENEVVNKVGTRRLAEASKTTDTKSVCIGNSLKIWDDAFPPPIEDIFECIPKILFDEIIVRP